MVELVGESLSATQSVGFVSLRIARVVGPGARSTFLFIWATLSKDRCATERYSRVTSDFG